MKTLLLAAVLAAVSVPALANQPGQSRQQAARAVPAAAQAPVVVASAAPAAGPAEAAPAGQRKVRVVLPSPYRTE